MTFLQTTLGYRDGSNAAVAWATEEVGELEITLNNKEEGLEELKKARDMLILLFGPEDPNAQGIETKLLKVVTS